MTCNTFKLLFLSFFLFFFVYDINAQAISGLNPAYKGTEHIYTYTSSGALDYRWKVTKGTIVEESESGLTYKVKVRWTETGIGSVKIERYDDSGGKNDAKWVTQSSRNITVNVCPSVEAPIANSAKRCGPGELTLAAQPSSVNYAVHWYASSTSLQILSTQNNYVVSSDVPSQNLYVSAFNPSTGCESKRVEVVAIINPVPAAPKADHFLKCGVGAVLLHASPGENANTIRWYESAGNGQAPVETSIQYLTQDLNASKVYFISSYNSNTGCESTLNYPKVQVNVNVDPTPPETTATVTGNSRFGPGVLNLTATGAMLGSTYNWYGMSGELLKLQSPSYQTSTITSSQVRHLFVKITNSSGCEGPSSWVDIQIVPNPSITSSYNRVIFGVPITLSTGVYDSYTWKNESGDIVSLDRTYSTNLAGSYTVTVTKSGIDGSATSLPFVVRSQMDGVNKNYIITNEVSVPDIKDVNDVENLSIENHSQVVQYFDGLGRPTQNISTQGSPDKYDVIQPTVYDRFGRESIRYLPYVSEADGHYKSNFIDKSNAGYTNQALSPQYKFYQENIGIIQNDTSPYAETVLEASLLSRVIKQGAAGKSWQPNAINTYTSLDHTAKKSYLLNVANEVLLWQYTFPTADYPLGLVNAGSNATPSFYAANQLYKNGTKDENGNEILEYKDKDGRTLLKRVQVVSGVSIVNDVNYASTYYVYDDFGNLVCVIPPEAVRQITATGSTAFFDQTDAVKDAFLKRWTFRYAYDSRKRMTQKQVPGAEAVYMVYDNRDRLVLTQDGNQRTSFLWTFTKYDELNRPIATGIKDTTAGLTLAEMQLGVNSHYAKSWAKYGDTYIGAADKDVHGYSNFSYPTVTTAKIVDPNRYLAVTYYDNYTFKNQYGDGYNYINDGLKETINGYLYEQRSSEFTNVIGQVTGTKVKVLDGGITGGYTWLKSISYYDDKYRVIQTISDNYKGGTDRTSILYDFIGKTLQRKSLHTENDILWTDLVAGYFTGNILKSTSASITWGLSGAASVQSLAAGQDGWVEFIATEVNTPRMIGLSSQNANAHYSTIGYAIYLKNDGTVAVYEGGKPKKDVGSYNPGDIFRIQRIGTAIKYFRNGQEIYPAGQTVTQAPSNSPLLVDVGFNALSSVAGVRASFANSSHTILKRYVYDHAGRLMETYHTLDNGPEVLLASNECNELGQLIDKDLHSVNGSAPMQSVDYRYNIRGWLTSINNSKLANDGATNNDAGDFFGMNLGYNESFSEETNTLEVVSGYALDGNANDQSASPLNGIVTGATTIADNTGNANKAYHFNGTPSNYIRIANSQQKHSFIQKTGRFTITAFIKLDDLAARNIIVSSIGSGTTKGFNFYYETIGGVSGTHQLRFTSTVGQTSYNVALGEKYTINDLNWHHVAVTGDGQNIRFYVDGVADGSVTPILYYADDNSTYETLIGCSYDAKGAKALGMKGAIDELFIFDRALSQSEIQKMAQRASLPTVLDNGQYNGNIAAIKWSNQQGIGPIKEYGYNFRYDALNRLSTATHSQSRQSGVWESGPFHESGLLYDLNGNIMALQRSSELGLIDNLAYNYGTGATQSNKLLSVTDKTTNAINKLKGFADNNTSGNDYTYDVNGNMTVDLNKGLSSPITYNYLNLPEVVTRTGNTIRYIYDATGRKLSQVVRAGFGIKQTDYAGEFVYEDDMLRFINHDEGRIVMSSEKLLYKHEGETLEGMTALNSTLSVITVNGEKYVNATSGGTGSGILPIGNAIDVVPGEKYLIRIKGYRSNYNAGIMIRRNKTTISYGSYLPALVSNEAWMEQIYVVPSNTSVLEIGVGWPVPTGTAGLNVNAFELIRLESAAPEYQYNLKDHLGNVRLTFTTKVEEDIYTATFEDGTQTDETNNFKNYSRVTSDMFDHTDAGTVYKKAQMLNGSSGSQVGLAKTLSVMPGDVIKAEVYAKYLGAEGSSTNLSSFGAALLSAFNLSAPLAGETGTARAALQEYGAYIEGKGNPGNEDSPKGWLNILVYDREYNLIDLALEQLSSDYVQQVGSLVKAPHQLLSKEVEIKEPGYVYIYVSNEGSIAQEIYFDDFMISRKKSQVIQSNDYYPFGLTFNSYERENSLFNLYQYNGKELQDELNIGWLDYGARMYMPELGRWNQMDQLSEKYTSVSPFNYALNSPQNAIDPDGKRVIFVNGHYNIILWSFGASPNSPKESYWKFFSSQVISAARDFVGASGDESNYFVDGSSLIGFDQDGADRHSLGWRYAEENYEKLVKGMKKGEAFRFVSHSEGGAFAAGMAAYLNFRAGLEWNKDPHLVTDMLYLSPDEVEDFESPDDVPNSHQLHYKNDIIADAKPLKGAQYTELRDSETSWRKAHGGTVTAAAISKLKTIVNQFVSSKNVEKLETKTGVTYKRK